VWEVSRRLNDPRNVRESRRGQDGPEPRIPNIPRAKAVRQSQSAAETSGNDVLGMHVLACSMRYPAFAHMPTYYILCAQMSIHIVEEGPAAAGARQIVRHGMNVREVQAEFDSVWESG
jgi:cytochrome c oxidase assembly protein Cox11